MREPVQDAFVAEVQAWDKGMFRENSATPDELRSKVVGALHTWLTRDAGRVDPKELLARALANIPQDRYGNRIRTPTLVISIAAGPTQAVLRPSELETQALRDAIQKAGMFDYPIFNKSAGVKAELSGDALVFR